MAISGVTAAHDATLDGVPDAPDLSVLGLDDATRRSLDFLTVAHGLTGVERLNRLVDGSRGETTAEHSWHLALYALVLHPRVAPETDLARVLAMLLVHDVVEVDVGDTPFHDTAARAAIADAEAAAAARLFGLLPPDVGEQAHALWEEFEAAETDEARFARGLDRLQPLVLHWSGDGSAWRQGGRTAAQLRGRLLATIEGFWPPLVPIAAGVIDDAERRGMVA